MDRNGVDFMILSMTGNTQGMQNTSTAVAQITQWNKKLADGVKGHQDQLGWFCILPLYDPKASIEQLEWCMGNGASGALVNGYEMTGLPKNQYNYYYGDEYNDFWKFVERNGIRIYLHPRNMEMRELFVNFPELQSSPWGFSMETAEHVLRLMLSGFFDKFPGINLIIGHNGEMLVDHRLYKQGWRPGQEPTPETKENGLHKRNHNVTYYLLNNVMATTSGWFDTPGFQHVLSVMGPDKLMFSIDTAYETIEDAASWFHEATKDMDPNDVEQISCGNTKRLFKKE